MRIGDRVKGVYTGNEGVLTSEPVPGINNSSDDYVQVVFDNAPDERQAVRVKFLELVPGTYTLGGTPVAEQEYRKVFPAEGSTNPKDLIGVTKPDLALVPPAALIGMALAMKNGADKYGAYNWRQKKVQVMIYLSACMRHIVQYLDGEQVADDSGVDHLGHAMACLGIVMDAAATGNLVDNRPTPGAASRLIKEATL